MKSYILLFAIIVFSALLTSCKKNYICECSGDTSGNHYSTINIKAESIAMASYACGKYDQPEHTPDAIKCNIR